MANDFYTPSNAPATSSNLSSATMRAEFQAIGQGMDKLPTLTGNALKKVRVNASGTGLEAVVDTVAASGVAFTPTGNIAATDVQAALAELDSEKQPAGSYLTAAAVGVSVQAYDANTAKTNAAQQFSARQRTTPLTDNDLSFDLAAANDFVCTPTAGGTLTFTNITAGCKGEIILVNNSNYAIAKAAAVKCPSSMLTTISATGRYRLAYSSLDGTNVDVTSSAALA